MSPVIPVNATVLLNKRAAACAQVQDGKIYFVRWFDDIRFARVRRDADSSFVFLYANKDEFFSSKVPLARWGKDAEIIVQVIQITVSF